MKKRSFLFFLIFLCLPALTGQTFVYAKNNDKETIQNLFFTWTEAFNKKNLDKSCALFSKKLQGNYQGAPAKNYENICAGFNKVFHDPKKTYHYRYKIHDIYLSDTFAAVRLTWYLTVRENNQVIEETQDEGLDILQKDHTSQWKIINYLAYPVIVRDNLSGR